MNRQRKKDRQRYILVSAVLLWFGIIAFSLIQSYSNLGERSLSLFSSDYDDIDVQPFGAPEPPGPTEREVYFKEMGNLMVKTLDLKSESNDLDPSFSNSQEIE